jgi:Tol biopolymer transport system component
MSQRTKIGYLGLAVSLALAVLAASLTWAAKPPPAPPPPLTNPALVYVEMQSNVYLGHYQGSICLMTADGSATRQLVRLSGGYVHRPTWSHDGSQIAFLHQPNTKKPWMDLYTVAPDGSGLQKVRSFSGAGFHRPNPFFGLSWTPDDTKIAYTCGECGQVAILDLLSGEIGHLPLLYPGEAGQSGLDFGPDLDPGKPGFQGLVAYGSGYWWTPQIAVVAVEITNDGTGALHINADEPVILEWQPMEGGGPVNQRGVAWSPDGRSLAYSQHNGRFIMLVDVDASSGVPVFGPPRVLWMRGSDSGTYAEYECQAAQKPAWSPDGQYVAFVSNIEVARIRTDGTGLTWLSSLQDKQWAVDPHWNPAWVNDLP